MNGTRLLPAHVVAELRKRGGGLTLALLYLLGRMPEEDEAAFNAIEEAVGERMGRK